MGKVCISSSWFGKPIKVLFFWHRGHMTLDGQLWLVSKDDKI